MKKVNNKVRLLGIVFVCCGMVVAGTASVRNISRSEDQTVEEAKMQTESTENQENVISIEKNEFPRVSSSAVEQETVTEEESVEITGEIVQEEPEQEETDLVIANVNNYVNIRESASEEAEVVGKLYDKSVGSLLGAEGDWYYIESGCVTGYVKGAYVLTGKEAIQRADKVGIKMARVTTTTLKVRTEPSLESKVVGLVPEGDLLTVSEETDGFVKVSVEEGDGYVSTDYVELFTENVVAESVQEEQERLQQEEANRKKAEEAAKKAIEKQKAVSSDPVSADTKEQAAVSASAPANSDLGQQIVDYAVQFVGNPYVYGGTSLTQGADCSGFVMSVYANFGISLPRTSGDQGKSGSSVASLASALPGDLVWYSGHIGIYMGNNQLVHASNAVDGIKISDVNYRPILGIRRIV